MTLDDDDLEQILGAARHARPKEHLVEVMRTHERRPRSLFYWSGSGRLRATTQRGVAHLERRYGDVGNGRGVRLTLPQLRAVCAACARWERTRDDWAAFYSSAAGLPGGFGCGYYYQPPGAETELVQVGRSMMGHLRGERLVGTDELVPLPRPLRVARGAIAVAEIWRRGERHGPPAGSLVGVQYELGNGLVFDARREAARIADTKGDEVFLERNERPFLRALSRHIARTVSSSPAART